MNPLIKKLSCLLFFSVVIFSCHHKFVPSSSSGVIETGYASFYSDNLKGHATSNGEKYDPSKLTAAHKKLPFGTMIKVTNLSNNRSVVVRINDRGPFVSGRIIDLSKAAAKQLDMIGAGVAKVKLEYYK